MLGRTITNADEEYVTPTPADLSVEYAEPFTEVCCASRIIRTLTPRGPRRRAEAGHPGLYRDWQNPPIKSILFWRD